MDGGCHYATRTTRDMSALLSTLNNPVPTVPTVPTENDNIKSMAECMGRYGDTARPRGALCKVVGTVGTDRCNAVIPVL